MLHGLSYILCQAGIALDILGIEVKSDMVPVYSKQITE